MKVSEDLYSKDVRETKIATWEQVPIRPTLMQSMYGNVKLLFGKRETKEFPTIQEAETWAHENGIIIRIHFGLRSHHSDDLQ